MDYIISIDPESMVETEQTLLERQLLAQFGYEEETE
jgi:hypothetical protein